VLTMNSVKILHAVRSASTAIAELLVETSPQNLDSWGLLPPVPPLATLKSGCRYQRHFCIKSTRQRGRTLNVSGSFQFCFPRETKADMKPNDCRPIIQLHDQTPVQRDSACCFGLICQRSVF